MDKFIMLRHRWILQAWQVLSLSHSLYLTLIVSLSLSLPLISTQNDPLCYSLFAMTEKVLSSCFSSFWPSPLCLERFQSEHMDWEKEKHSKRTQSSSKRGKNMHLYQQRNVHSNREYLKKKQRIKAWKDILRAETENLHQFWKTMCVLCFHPSIKKIMNILLNCR